MWPASSIKRGSNPLCLAFHDRSRVERHEAERLGLRRIDNFPDIDVHAVAHQRQLVDEADVHRPERVFEELDHLGNARRTDRHDRVDGRTVERTGELDARRREPADNFRNVVRLKRRVARIDALRGEGEKEILAGLQSRRLEYRLNNFVRRPRIRRRLEADEQAGMQMLRNRLHCGDDVGHVGVLRLAKRCRDADIDGVELFDDTKVRRRIQLARLVQRLDVGCGDIRNIRTAFLDGCYFARVQIDAGCMESGLSKFHRQRQADVSQSDDARPGTAGLDLFEQRRGKCGHSAPGDGPAPTFSKPRPRRRLSG